MGRLNVQGLARRDPGLMRCILPEEDHRTVSIDLGAGEPTVTAHFSQDPFYRYACFDGVGKPPLYCNGVLKIDDIYLMTMSVSPIGRKLMWDTYHNHKFNGKNFVEQWLEDPEVIKTYFKKMRQLHKMLALALGYGMGPRKMIKQCYDNGFAMDEATAKAFYRAYWELFAGVRRLADKLARMVEMQGFIVNPFGYRMTPPPHKAFNYFIQSSVSGIMHVFCYKLMTVAPYAHFSTVIHDELVADVPVTRLDDFRAAKELATVSLNEDLKWSVNIRTGFAVGDNWYEAK